MGEQNSSNKNNKRKSLILAGGGMKVAFQAGVLQVWLDEAGLGFDHADGASGGLLNLAMYCQGMSGKEIADNWRKLDPKRGISFNWWQYFKFLYAKSIFKLDRYRTDVFPLWGLDWERIRASEKDATFNVYNFSKHRLEVLSPQRMTEDHLVAGISLPMWFPPVVIDGDHHIDAVFITDANLEAAIERGADEIWVIWTVSDGNRWDDGFIANYFQIIETSANGHFKRIANRILTNNEAIEAGRTGEFGRHIELKLLKAEVPMHYLINLSKDRMTEAVERGVRQAREWCREQGIPLERQQAQAPERPLKLEFTEEMKGYITAGVEDYDAGFRRGREEKNNYIAFRLTIETDDLDRFLVDPDHEAAAKGTLRCEALGGEFEVRDGVFNLFVDKGDPHTKHMRYRLPFTDKAGRLLTLSGYKFIKDDPGFDAWSDTTTLFVHIVEGHPSPSDPGPETIVASGIMQIYIFDFLQQLTTFRVDAPTPTDKAKALARFGRLFMGSLWDVYATRVLSYGPL